MAGVVFMASADMGDKAMFTVGGTDGSITASATKARTGTYSFRLGSTSNLGRNIPSRADYYQRIAYNADSVQTDALEITFKEGTTKHVRIVLDLLLGVIRAYRDASSAVLLGTSPVFDAYAGRWYLIESYVKVHDSTGVVTVKLDGTQVLNLTGVDTRNAGTAGAIDNILWDNNASTFGYFDDILVRDDAWPGAGGLFVQVPTGPGVNAGFTASAGNPYECVDEVPIVATDYISKDASVLNTIHDFAHAGLPAGTYVTVPAYGVVSKAKLSGSGSGNIRNKLLSSGSAANGASSALSTSEAWTAALYGTTNPNGGGALSKAIVDAMTFGVETI